MIKLDCVEVWFGPEEAIRQVAWIGNGSVNRTIAQQMVINDVWKKKYFLIKEYVSAVVCFKRIL